MSRYAGKVALITGGNSGIGLATAKRLKEEGAAVVIVGRDEQTLNEAASEFGFIAVRADVAHVPEIDDMFRVALEHAGKIDVLFANAGIYKTSLTVDTTEPFFDELVDINLKGLFFTVQKALPYLNDGASIILTGSTVSGKGCGNGRLQRHQGGGALAGANVLRGIAAPRNPRECGEPRRDNDADFWPTWVERRRSRRDRRGNC